MPVSQLIRLQWKESFRSTVWQKQIAINIILGIFIFYLLLNLLVMGLFLDKILLSAFPEDNPVALLNGWLLYYFLADLLMRFYLQELPVLQIQPLLHLPIRRSTLIHYLLTKSALSFFNWLPLLIWVPFGLKVIAPAYGTAAAWAWIMALFLLMLANNYLITYLKRLLVVQMRWLLAFILFIGLVLLLDYAGVFSLSAASGNVFGWLLGNPLRVLVPLALLAGSYVLNYQFVKSHLYPEEITRSRGGQSRVAGDFSFLQRFGPVGELIALELQLIWRHKRTRSVVMVSAMLLAYGLVFYPNESNMQSPGLLLFVATFVTGMFLFNYGQFMLSWEGSYFDALLTQRISLRTYFLAKFWLFTAACLISFVLALPYAYFGWKIIGIHLVAMLFNIGINSFIVMYFATFSPKRIDLSRSSMMNYQGVGASQFILMVPTLLAPVLTFMLFRLIGGEALGFAAVGLLGLLGIAFHQALLSRLVRRFEARKYQIAAGFRQE